jgi:hypothetical protein
MSIQGNAGNVGRYISVPQTIQLIPKPFDGNPMELCEFIQNVESTYEVVDPLDCELLFKFVHYVLRLQVKQKLNFEHYHTKTNFKTSFRPSSIQTDEASTTI